jgi:O-acetyl-ADP-ribose deacetylase (regulator of RNase III)
MRVTLFDINKNLCHEWEKEFTGVPDVTVLNLPLENLKPHDCLVTAGNSFGAMSGGIDLAVRDMFGYGVQDTIQMGIMRLFPYGIPIGDILTVDLPHNGKFQNLFYVPTMRTPSLARTADIMYSTMIAFMTAAEKGIRTMALPGMGTGCGQLSPQEASKAMRIACDTAARLNG